jgi:phosphatidate cytidylyltransferase
MALNLPVFYKRTGSAIVFAVIMLAGLLWNEWAFYVLACLINGLCLREYFKLIRQIDKETYWPAWLPAAIQLTGFIIISLIAVMFTHSITYSHLDYLLIFTVSFICILPAVLLLASCLSKQVSLFALLQSLGGIFYITLPMLLLVKMEMHHFILPMAVIFMIWTNDTMAYLVGSFIGKTSFSSISPKKTWEGVIGGIILTIGGAAIYGYFSQGYSMINWMLLALFVTIAGTLGDLLESKLKRMAQVKDSGAMMPGHGGALDRFDSLLVAAPFAFVYTFYFMR